MLRRSVNDAHEERPGVHIQAMYTDSRFEQFGSSRTMFALIASVAYNMSLVYAILYRVAASLLTGLHFCTYIFSVITMSLFGLQVWGALKMTDMKLQDMKLTDRVAGHEIAGHENGGPNSRT